MSSLYSTHPTHLLISFLTFLTLLPKTVLSTDPPSGPTAPISLSAEPAFSTARPCAQTCIAYSGPFQCGLKLRPNDLPYTLGCGCSPQNYCLCGTTAAASASSFISMCVSAGCSAYGNVADDVNSMVALYDGYCATANKAASTTGSPTKTTAGASVTGVTPGIGASISQVSATSTATENSTPTSLPADGGGGGDEGGLSKSDIIALASGLGVGVPSLIIAAVALWFQMRKKKVKSEMAAAVALEQSPQVTGSYTQIASGAPTPAATPPPTHAQYQGGGQMYGQAGAAGGGIQGYAHGGGGGIPYGHELGGGHQWGQAYELQGQGQNTRRYR